MCACRYPQNLNASSPPLVNPKVKTGYNFSEIRKKFLLPNGVMSFITSHRPLFNSPQFLCSHFSLFFKFILIAFPNPQLYLLFRWNFPHFSVLNLCFHTKDVILFPTISCFTLKLESSMLTWKRIAIVLLARYFCCIAFLS